MGLFFNRKKEAACSCAAPAPQAAGTPAPDAEASVLVLGSGCAKCNELEQSVRTALAELGMDDTVGHVTDFGQIAAWGVMATPALVVDGKVVSSGRVLKPDEAKRLIREARP